MDKNFTIIKIDYIKCPECKNILDMSFVNKSCPNPLCGFNFDGLEPYLNKNDDELRKLLVQERKDKNDKEYKLIVTAIKHNIGTYLAHFIECTWKAHYETLYSSFLLNFLDDLNVLKIVLKSDVIKEEGDAITSKNGYKMYWELYCRLKKLPHNPDISNFLKTEFPDLHRKHYTKWFLKWDRDQKEKRSDKNLKATLF